MVTSIYREEERMFRVTLRFPPLAYRVAAIHKIIYRPGSLCHRNVVTGVWSSIFPPPPRPPQDFLFFSSFTRPLRSKGLAVH